MSLFAIADTHLSFGSGKPMDVFRGWQDYERRLEENWRAVVSEGDTVVVAGDISWAMTLPQAAEDFRFLDALPGRKLIMKGNHDYWWSTASKAYDFFNRMGISSLDILHNNAFRVGDLAVCGTRGWFFDGGEDTKLLLREAGRLRASIARARELGGEPVVFLHYPPIVGGQICREIYEVLVEESISLCCYGHLHGAACSRGFTGVSDGIRFSLISSDFLGFCPKLIG